MQAKAREPFRGVESRGIEAGPETVRTTLKRPGYKMQDNTTGRTTLTGTRNFNK
jgi:hypothetical protein